MTYPKLHPVSAAPSTTFTAATLLSVGLWATAPTAAWAATTTFDNGYEGWNFSAYTDIAPDGGNPGANATFTAVETFGASVYSQTNPAFVGNYTASGGPITLSLDVNVSSITYLGNEVPRRLVLDLRDLTTPNPGGYPYTSVYYVLGTISAGNPGWQHFSVTIDDPNSLTLPAGWGGYGDEDADANPQLPPDRTFNSVLQHVDALYFTTFQPGYVYGYTDFQMAFDNLSVTGVVPEPSTYAMLAVGGGLIGFIGRRRRRTVASGQVF